MALESTATGPLWRGQQVPQVLAADVGGGPPLLLRRRGMLTAMTHYLHCIVTISSHNGPASHSGGLTLTSATELATLIAAIVAIVALGLAWYSIRSSNRALIRERQLTFELGVLAQLAHACAHLFTGGEQNEALALTRLLPGELEGLRRKIEERAAKGPAFSASERVLSEHWAEYEEAVSKRLQRRR